MILVDHWHQCPILLDSGLYQDLRGGAVSEVVQPQHEKTPSGL